MITLGGWNKDNMFFLTRDGNVKISHSDENESALFHYANQCLDEHPPKEKLDVFGRNYIDKMFIRLCEIVHVIVTCSTIFDISFRSLSCTKIDEQYMVRLELSNEILEMEMIEMIQLLEFRYGSKMSRQ